MADDLGTFGGSTSTAFAINDAGHAVGSAQTALLEAATRAFIYYGSGELRPLGTLGGSTSIAFGVNNADQVVGRSNPSDTGMTWSAFLWQDGSMRDLGTLYNGYTTEARGINDLGQVVGRSTSSDPTDDTAFLWEDDQMRALTTGSSTTHSVYAYDINNAGQVVGSFSPSNGVQRAALWESDGTMRDLGTLSPNTNSYAYAINDRGQVVGYAGGKAFLWQSDTGMINLESLLPADKAPPHWYLSSARGINNAGQIVGLGSHNGLPRAFLLTPALVVDAGWSYSVGEGDSVTLTAIGHAYGDSAQSQPLSYAWDLDNDGDYEAAGQSVDFSAADRDGPSSQKVAVRATDSAGRVAFDTAMVIIENVAPKVLEIVPGNGIGESSAPMPFKADFIDPGVRDTHTASWDWGDFSFSGGTVSEQDGAGTVSGEHAYSAPGVYTVTLTVTDADGATSQSSIQVSVGIVHR